MAESQLQPVHPPDPCADATKKPGTALARSSITCCATAASTPPPNRQNIGSQRLLRAANKAELHDTCLWTPLAAATGAQGNSTALVGSPETVAKALLEYYKLGATRLLIRGYDPRPDAVQYGEALIPRVRELVAQYDAVAEGEVQAKGGGQRSGSVAEPRRAAPAS